MVPSIQGQQYALDWSTVDGGGGTSTGGVYTGTGTAGQPTRVSSAVAITP